MRVYIIGIRGFIGSTLHKLFEADGHQAFGHGRNEPFVDEECDLLVDATHQKGIGSVKKHADNIYQFCLKNNIQKVELLQSFATIEAKEFDIDENALNFGLRYTGCSNYGVDKVEKEKIFIERFSSSNVVLGLHYLPAVFGEGSGWDGLKWQLNHLYTENYTIYMPDIKAFFFTDVDMVYKSVCLEGENKVNRYLVYNPKSLTTSISDLLLPNEEHNPVSYPYNSRLLYTFLKCVGVFRHRIAFKLISGFDTIANKLLAKLKIHSFPAFSYWDAFAYQDKLAKKLLK